MGLLARFVFSSSLLYFIFHATDEPVIFILFQIVTTVRITWQCDYGSSSVNLVIKNNNMTSEWIAMEDSTLKDDYTLEDAVVDEVLDAIKQKARSMIDIGKVI